MIPERERSGEDEDSHSDSAGCAVVPAGDVANGEPNDCTAGIFCIPKRIFLFGARKHAEYCHVGYPAIQHSGNPAAHPSTYATVYDKADTTVDNSAYYTCNKAD